MWWPVNSVPVFFGVGVVVVNVELRKQNVVFSFIPGPLGLFVQFFWFYFNYLVQVKNGSICFLI